MLRRRISRVLSGLAVCTLLVSCTGNSDESKTSGGTEISDLEARQEYGRVATELKLAESDDPYLVLDFDRRVLLIKLKGAVVWSCALAMSGTDSAEMSKYLSHLREKRSFDLQPIVGKHLFAFQPRIPDSLLTVVSSALDVKPDLLQRDLPSCFQLTWDNGLVLEFQTEIKGKPKAPLKNILRHLHCTLQRLCGQRLIVLKMSATDALTLYRVVRPCMPTLIIL